MSPEFTLRRTLASPEQTAAFARGMAPGLGAGDTILLHGNVGAGKTHFARALIQARLAAAGRLEDVPSPTFTLVQTYRDGKCEIWHADLYRISDPMEVVELGLDDAFRAFITLVEWPEALGNLAPAGALNIAFEITQRTGQRQMTVRGAEDPWRGRVDAAILAAGLD